MENLWFPGPSSLLKTTNSHTVSFIWYRALYRNLFFFGLVFIVHPPGIVSPHRHTHTHWCTQKYKVPSVEIINTPVKKETRIINWNEQTNEKKCNYYYFESHYEILCNFVNNCYLLHPMVQTQNAKKKKKKNTHNNNNNSLCAFRCSCCEAKYIVFLSWNL